MNEAFDHLEVSREIAASPEEVYAAVSDVTRMGEWSPECVSCEWLDGADGPEVGAEFDGHNRLGDNEWTTQGRVVAAEPGRRFVFECRALDFHFSTWGYEIEPTGGGCRVTETWDDLRPDSVKEMSRSISGVEDRSAHNRAGMTETLGRLAAVLEV